MSILWRDPRGRRIKMQSTKYPVSPSEKDSNFTCSAPVGVYVYEYPGLHRKSIRGSVQSCAHKVTKPTEYHAWIAYRGCKRSDADGTRGVRASKMLRKSILGRREGADLKQNDVARRCHFCNKRHA
jgi:hypothetical protein